MLPPFGSWVRELISTTMAVVVVCCPRLIERPRTTSTGKRVPSDTDLVEKCGPEKFEYVSGGPDRKRQARAEREGKSSLGQLPASHPARNPQSKGSNPAAEDLHTYTVPELKQLAEAEEIDTRNLKTKEDFIKALSKK